MSGETESPVAFVVHVGTLPKRGLPVAIEADAAQRAALAEAHGLAAVERFDAALTVAPWRGDGVRVSGRVEARIVQRCVVTLEPVVSALSEEVSALFVPPRSRLARRERDAGEMVLDPEGDDPPEPLQGDRLDVGAVAEEFFALAIDPYPRKQGAALDAATTEAEGAETGGPLSAGLAKLRRRR